MLTVEGICKRFDGTIALWEINLQLAEGEGLGLYGPNGAGKTTLLDVITGYLRPERGTVHFRGHCLLNLRPHHIVRLGIARTFQIPRLCGDLTVEEHLALARLHTRGESLSQSRKRVASILEESGLLGIRKSLVSTLSQGMVRKLEIARALATDPILLLLDEPFSALSPGDASGCLELLRQVRTRGVGLLVVAHSPKFLKPLVDRAAIMKAGRLVGEVRPEELEVLGHATGS